VEYKQAVEGDQEALREAARIVRLVNRDKDGRPDAQLDWELNGWMMGGQYRMASVASVELADVLADMFDAWARMGELDLDMLNRVGGTELVAMARIIVKGDQG
jgi:hypothetical protein